MLPWKTTTVRMFYWVAVKSSTILFSACNVFRLEARAGLCSLLTFTMTFEWSVMPVWRRKSLTQGKYCCAVGTSGTNTSFQPADGNLTIPPKLMINTQSKINLLRSNKIIIYQSQLYDLFQHQYCLIVMYVYTKHWKGIYHE